MKLPWPPVPTKAELSNFFKEKPEGTEGTILGHVEKLGKPKHVQGVHVRAGCL